MTATIADQRRLKAGDRALVELALADIRVLVRNADAQSVQTLRAVLPAVIETYGLAAASLAADWYDDVRADSEAVGLSRTARNFSAIPADLDDQGADALVGWAISTATDDQTFESLISGGTQRRIVNFSRSTVMGSSVADPDADGWQRSTDGDACGFCLMLASRGAVYRTGDTATFGPHDDCGCEAVPAFGGEPVPVRPFEPSARDIPQADQDRANQWMRDHGLI